MTLLDKVNFIAFNPLANNNSIAVRRRKLITKINEQIQLATNKDYSPTQHKWVTDEDGSQRKVEVAKRDKRWWTASVDGKINLVMCYGSKPLEFANAKKAFVDNYYIQNVSYIIKLKIIGNTIIKIIRGMDK
tara:strand:- start:338 stop:733 length:396 start_codon:yes stop_codon:yes gene_type:complete